MENAGMFQAGILLACNSEKAKILNATSSFFWIRVGRPTMCYWWQRGKIWGCSGGKTHQREPSKVHFLKLDWSFLHGEPEE